MSTVRNLDITFTNDEGLTMKARLKLTPKQCSIIENAEGQSGMSVDGDNVALSLHTEIADNIIAEPTEEFKRSSKRGPKADAETAPASEEG